MDDTADTVAVELPQLEVRAAGHIWHATPGRLWTIGRSSDADIVLDNPRVSRKQAVLEPSPAGWIVVNHSRNGMFVDGRRIERVTVRHPTTVSLGSATSGERMELAPKHARVAGTATSTVTGDMPSHRAEQADARAPSAVHSVEGLAITIGRSPDNNVVLDDLLVSRRHAVLRRSGDHWELADLGSENGTYVNGARIAHAVICPDDVVGIGHQRLHLAGDRLEEYVDTGNVSFEASALRVVTKSRRVLLDDVGFDLPKRSFLAVVGPSGAGKSTLLGALTGFRPADGGQVCYADRDLYENYAELRHRIGFVPQDDILHTPLTVRRALTYAAQLRFPQDVSAAERRERIDEVLAELGLTEHADQRIDSLSGGQRKRTSVALELLTKPSLLFLDEPTSGLDPGYEKSVMQTLRALADGGRSVVVVTHNVAQLNLCDRLLILAPGGRLAYFGPPQHALAYFHCSDFADLFTLLERESATDWTGRFAASNLSDAFARPRTTAGSSRRADTAPPEQAAAQQSAWTQFTILCRRYVAVIAADRQYSVFMAVLPLLLSLFAHAAPGRAGLSVSRAITLQSTQPAQLLVLLIIGGALMGSATSIREIVKERAIYRREHGIGLSRGAYLASKLVVLTALTCLQGVVLGLLGVVGLPGPDQPVVLPWAVGEVAVAVVAVTVVSMIVGLVVSAMIGNADRGMPLLVLVVMAQLILCGGLFAVHGRVPLEQLSWLAPSRWAYAMGASTVNLNAMPRSPGGGDPLWHHTAASWCTALGMCAALAIVMVVVIVLLLSRLDSRRRARR